MKRQKRMALTMALIAINSQAFADTPIAKGSYADINIGYSKITDLDTSDVTGLGLNVNLGYKFMPFFGLEIGYTTYGASNSSFTGANTFDAAIKGIVPFQEVGLELYAKVGPAYIQNSNSDNGSDGITNIYYGFGGAYALTPTMLLTVQWTEAVGNSDTGNLQLLSIGVAYLFG